MEIISRKTRLYIQFLENEAAYWGRKYQQEKKRHAEGFLPRPILRDSGGEFHDEFMEKLYGRKIEVIDFEN